MPWQDFVFRDEMVRLVETRRKDGRICLAILISPGQVVEVILTPHLYSCDSVYMPSTSGHMGTIYASLGKTKPFHEGGDELDGHFNEGNLTKHDYRRK